MDRHLDDLTERCASDPEFRRRWQEVHGPAPVWSQLMLPPLSAAERARRARRRRLRQRIRAIARQLLVEELPEAVSLLTQGDRR